MGFASPFVPGAMWPRNSDFHGHGNAPHAGHASTAAMDTVASTAYRALRELLAESNWLGQAAPLLAELDETSEQIYHRRASVSARARGVLAPPSGLMQAYGQVLSAVPRGVGALKGPVFAFDSRLQPALTSLARLSALGVTVAATPPMTAKVPGQRATGSGSVVADQRHVSASLGSAGAVQSLSVPAIWAAATSVRSGVVGSDESCYATHSFATRPAGGFGTTGRRRLYAVTTT